ncbi:hypothetical protein [Tautonia rosea]|uniref:hypothetical protein n=1 Tax=Tautonia rosea TaxID=2728037 RepID=UPI001473D83B|nr:hypothetical protein [Tautonia rosea]
MRESIRSTGRHDTSGDRVSSPDELSATRNAQSPGERISWGLGGSGRSRRAMPEETGGLAQYWPVAFAGA